MCVELFIFNFCGILCACICSSVFSQQQRRCFEWRGGSVSDQEGSRHHVCDAEQSTQEPADGPVCVGPRGHQGDTLRFHLLSYSSQWETSFCLYPPHFLFTVCRALWMLLSPWMTCLLLWTSSTLSTSSRESSFFIISYFLSYVYLNCSFMGIIVITLDIFHTF